MGDNRKNLQRSETMLTAALLAAAGGFLDAYTYLCRGGVFANAQTGNIVLLGIHLAQREWRLAAYYLIPIGAFALGVVAAEAVKARCVRPAGRLHWRHFTLGMEILILTLAAFLPRGEWDTAVNVLVSFTCAVQVESFRKFRGNAFASTMCTGNLRSGTEALYHGLRRKDGALVEKGVRYYGVIGCFVAGAALGGAVSAVFPQRGILMAAALQLGAFLWMCRRAPKKETSGV